MTWYISLNTFTANSCSNKARGHIIYYTVNYWPTSNSEDINSINVPHNITRVEISVGVICAVLLAIVIVIIIIVILRWSFLPYYLNLNVLNILPNSHKRVFSQSSKVKCKPVPPPRRRPNEKEDKVSDSGDGGLEMKDVVVIVEEDEGNYCFEHHSNIGPPGS